jgi:hypothetical protein
MGDYQNENKTAALLSSILAALGGGTSDGGAFTPGATAFTLVGGEVDDTSTSTVSEGNAGAARMTSYRALHVNLRDSAGNEVPPALSSLLQEVKTDTSGNSTAFSTFGATANLHNHVTAVTIANSSASTFCTVDLRDGTAGSVIWTFPVPASGGVTMNFDPPLRQPTANTALAFDPSAAVTTVTIAVHGYQA